MEVQVLDKTDERMKLAIHGSSTQMMNALRRLIVSEVPCMSIDDVVIIENSSVLHDEILAHRLGLMPLKTDLDTYNLPEECDCNSEFGCNKCRVSLLLEAESLEGVKTIYSRDIVSENPDISPVNGNIPIVKIGLGQKIRLEAYAKLGKGKDHARWQPVSLCLHRYLPKIKVNKDLCDSCAGCVDVCPEKIYKKENGGITLQNEIECTMCMDCVDVCPKSALEVSWDGNSFVFSIETTGGLTADRVFREAFKLLGKKTEELKEKIDGLGLA